MRHAKGIVKGSLEFFSLRATSISSIQLSDTLPKLMPHQFLVFSKFKKYFAPSPKKHHDSAMKTAADQNRRLSQWAFWIIIYTLLVIVWGAWVRISHSGDGCGKSWPLCEGEFIPSFGNQKTWIEYFHRLMSGTYGLMIIGLFIWVRKQSFSAEIKKWSLAVFLLMMTEALLGAKLVLFGLVGTNDSLFRVFVMAFHQLNSFLLMGATMLLFLASQRRMNFTSEENESVKRSRKVPLAILFGLLLVAMTGAWASLSNTLYPSEGIIQGLMKDFSQDAHPLVRLRILHPLFATILCCLVLLIAWVRYLAEQKQKDLLILVLFITALLFGWMTLFFHAPVWMKISHLMIAHGVWLASITLIHDWSQQDGSRTEPVR